MYQLLLDRYVRKSLETYKHQLAFHDSETEKLVRKL